MQHSFIAFGIQLMRVTEQRWLLRGLPKVLRALDISDSLLQLIDNKNELTHSLFCLQLIKYTKLTSSFSYTQTIGHDIVQMLLSIDNWQQHTLKPCKIISWSEL
ncbi:MAG: hypothetical protein ACK4PR_12665, partial [Gammaproteobacteria bacterium]